MKKLISFAEEKKVHPEDLREPRRASGRVPEHLLRRRQPSLSEAGGEEERGKRQRKSDGETALTPVWDSRRAGTYPPELNFPQLMSPVRVTHDGDTRCALLHV